jgi:GNAT superfamily N-acetyltransferase
MVLAETVQVERAQVADCRALADTSERAFERDVDFGAPCPGGPPGYDSPAWHRRAFTCGHVFRIVHDDRIVGGAIVIPHDAGRMELGRIWLEPSAQGHGWGQTAMTAIEEAYPEAFGWQLETPTWNMRTQRLYTKAGYRPTRRTASQIVFQKRC